MPNSVDGHVGHRLRLLRQKLGLSQGALGDLLGISFQQVQKYERGANRIGASRLHQLAVVLQVPITYFFDDDVVARRVVVHAAIPPALGDPATLRLVRAFAQIESSTVKQRAVRIIEAIAQSEPH